MDDKTHLRRDVDTIFPDPPSKEADVAQLPGPSSTTDPSPGDTSYPSAVLRREVIAPHPEQSVRVLTHDFPSEICGWGFHPEYELHLITKTHGSFIAGDHIGTFGPGHVSLIGPNLPHDWVSDLPPGEVAVDRDAVIQFSDEWIRGCMSVIPEVSEVDAMLRRSSRGLVFTGATAWRAAEAILDVVASDGVVRVARLFALLGLLARAPQEDRQVVASEWMAQPTDPDARSAVEAGLSYIFDNLNGHIRLATAAHLAYMSEPTFSKYFKSAAGMPFSAMVKKLRVAHARRLLDTTDRSVARVAAESGYRNMANFNRQFLAEVGMTPTAYRRLEASEKPPPELLSLMRRAPDA